MDKYMKKYRVDLVQHHTVILFAEDEQDAKNIISNMNEVEIEKAATFKSDMSISNIKEVE